MWDYPGTDRIEPKHSYVDRLEKWGWLIGAGVYVTDVEDAVAELEAAAATDLREGIIFASLLGLGLFVVIALIAYALVRRTLGPIKRTTAAMHDIAQGRGDLTRRLAVESGDEIGELSVQFNAFVARMQDTLRDVRRSTLSVHQAAGRSHKVLMSLPPVPSRRPQTCNKPQRPWKRSPRPSTTAPTTPSRPIRWCSLLPT
ncbi:hypothetical protein HORIV_67800 [Vreelandella olivaria]|uniref:HAMP domain-containing protein n=1 Tax=Vreelandella olivaria TaxID=390919 RepID=A0ABN5X4Z9_9GAMM|nr:hypothetical protein HORIV_67800 [Halomonas olivaria]